MANGGELVKFEDKVKEKLLTMVADLIPPEKVDEIVQKSIDEFERVHLPQLIKSELTVKYTELIKELFNSDEWRSNHWDNKGNEVATKKVKEMMLEIAPDLLVSVFGNMFSRFMVDFRNNIPRY